MQWQWNSLNYVIETSLRNKHWQLKTKYTDPTSSTSLQLYLIPKIENLSSELMQLTNLNAWHQLQPKLKLISIQSICKIQQMLSILLKVELIFWSLSSEGKIQWSSGSMPLLMFQWPPSLFVAKSPSSSVPSTLCDSRCNHRSGLWVDKRDR